jgi:hypothetical protein
MTTTRPWLDDPTLREASELDALLDAGRELGAPPEGAKDALWARLELAAIAAGAGAAAGGLAGSSTTSLAPGSAALGAGSVGSTTATTTASVATVATSSIAASSIAAGSIAASSITAATTAAATTTTAASAVVAASGGVLATIGGKLAVVAMVSAIGVGGMKLANDARSSSPSVGSLEAPAIAPTTLAQRSEALAPHANPTGAPSPAMVPTAPPTAAEVVPEPSATSRAAESSSDSLPPAHGGARPTSIAPAAPRPAPSAGSPLVREAEGVARAREALRGGRAAEALAILGELDRTIRGGALGQERAVYAIEALAATGRATEAQQAARAFLAANPSSPYAARIERFVTH